MKRNLLILILFMGYTMICNAKATQEVDSLRMLLTKLPQSDTTRLAHLRRIAVIEQSTVSGLEAAKELYKEANRLGNDKYKCYASFYMSLYYSNNGILDSINIFAYEAIQLAEKEKLWKTYFEVARITTNLFIVKEEFEYAIDEATKMYNKARELNSLDGKMTASIGLATAYIGSDRIKESVDILKEAYEKVPNTSNVFILIEIQSLLASTAYYMSNYDELYTYLKDMNKTIDNYLKNNPFSDSYYSLFLFIDIHYAYYYIAKDQPQEALTYLKKAESLKTHPSFAVHNGIFYDAYAEYYFSLKEYDKAIAAVDASIVDLRALMPKDYYKQLAKKAYILSESGRSREALPFYQESLQGRDSIDHVLSCSQIEQIQNIYNVNSLLLENERIKSSRQLTLLIIISLFTGLLTLFIIRILFVRKKLKEAEYEMRKAAQIAKETNEVKNLFLSNMSYNIRTPLNSVVGFSQLIAIEPNMNEVQRKEYSDIIKKNSDILLNLVNEVLDLSRLEAGMMKFNLQKYDVLTLCEEAIYTAESKRQPIKINYLPQFKNQEIEVDIYRFNQLLVSLLTYPTPVDKEITITLFVELNKIKNCVCFKTIDSPIANPKFITQEVSIRNEINKLFLKRFKGTYKVNTENPKEPTIVFTYPLSISK